MFKKDDWYPAIIGFITAFFVSLILLNNKVVLPIPLWSLFILLPVGEFLGYAFAARIFSKMTSMKQLGRFGIVGIMNFSVDTGIVTTLSIWTRVFSGFGLIGLNFISTTIAIINSYFWQRSWTFGETAPASKKEFFGFVVVTIIGIIVNGAIVYLITTFIEPFDGLTPVRLETSAKVGATLISLFWNFLGYKFFVFQ